MTDRLRVTLVGSAPARVLRALDRAGVELADDAPLHVVWAEDPTARAWLNAWPDASAVALCDRPEIAADVLDNGVMDAIVGLPDQLGARLRVAARVDARWRARFDQRVNEALRTTSELQSTRDLLSRLVDASPCPVMAVGPRGDVLVYNHAAEQLLGYPADWARENLDVRDVYANPADAMRVLAAVRAAPQRLVRGLTLQVRKRDGSLLTVKLNAAEIYAADGLAVATVGVFLDTRQVDDLERRLDVSTRQLLTLELRARRLEDDLGRVHLFNQPLSAAMMAVEIILLKDELSEVGRERMLKHYAQLEELAETVRDLTELHHRSPDGHRLLDPLADDDASLR